MLVGYPASTKSTYTRTHYGNSSRVTVLSRDVLGGTTANLLPLVEESVNQHKNVILDNTHLTKESRAPFIELAKRLDARIHAIYFKTSLEDCQVRALRRMWQKYSKIFLLGKPPKGNAAENDPGVFPPAALFAARKNLVEPSREEGFDYVSTVVVEPPKWDGRKYKGKALFLDIDGTVRETEHLPFKYPTSPDQVKLIGDVDVMRATLNDYRKQGYMLIGISNQSGIAANKVTEEAVVASFNKTRELLGYTEAEFPIMYCPHGPVPVRCYCRKPQVGIPIMMLEKFKLNPINSILVGDMKTDETVAVRAGMQFILAKDFWKQTAGARSST